jgi:hypothetical protein
MEQEQEDVILSPSGFFSLLDEAFFSHVLATHFSSATVVRLGCCSKELAERCLSSEFLWRALLRRYCAMALEHLRLPDVPPEQLFSCSSLRSYPRAAQLVSLPRAAWRDHEEVHRAMRRTDVIHAREGLASASVGGSMLLVGGWTNYGLANDVHALRLSATGSLHSQRKPFVGDHVLPPRYGHAACSCGPDHRWLLVFAGMTSGGYTGELSDVWVARPSTDVQLVAPLGSLDAEDELFSSPYEWHRPEVSGDKPTARGYCSLTASRCGRFVYAFGGIADGASISELAVLDTQDWSWRVRDRPATPASWPGPRFGHSTLMFDAAGGGESLWLFGGGVGGDLLRDGYDLTDVWRLDCASGVWTEEGAEEEPMLPQTLGRCHSSVRVGSKALFFGGSKHTSGGLTWFDTASRAFGTPELGLTAEEDAHGLRRPRPRFTHAAQLLGTRLVVACGWTYGGLGGDHRGPMSDFWSAELCPGREREWVAQSEEDDLVLMGGGEEEELEGEEWYEDDEEGWDGAEDEFDVEEVDGED